MRSIRRFGAISLVALSGCIYGFAGGGLPRNIKTVAVIPFENETAAPELQLEVTEALRRGIESRLGLRSAAEARANAIVRGVIRRYEPDVPVSFSADPRQANTARRRLQIVIDVEIVDQTTGKTLLQRSGLSADGDYAENAEADGRRQAIQALVREVIEGAQSQW